MKKLSNVLCKKLFVVMLFSVSISLNGFAQETKKLNVVISLKVKGGDLKNSQVTVTRKDAPFMVLDPGKGENSLELPLGYEYVFTFTKLGYVSQNIYVDTHVPENREKNDFRTQIFKIQLEKEASKEPRENVKIAYSKAINDFDFIRGDFKPEKVVKKPPVKTNETKPEIKANANTNNQAGTGERVTKNGSKIKDKKVIQMDTKKITVITVSVDSVEYTFKKEEFDWGGVFYYKNDVRITSDVYANEAEEK